MAQSTKKRSTRPTAGKLRGEISDAAVLEATGKTPSRWFAILDRSGARTMTHTEIARTLNERHGVSGWWSQMVTVAYERRRGLRSVNQRRGGTFYVSVSRTLGAPVSEVYRAWEDARRRASWLGRPITVRTASRNKSMRITWDDDSSVHVYFVAKGPAKSQIAVQHEKLTSAAHVARAKTYWAKTLEKLRGRVEA
jgi:hypothetical protein